MRNVDISPLRPDRLVWRFMKSGGIGKFTKPIEQFDQTSRELVLNAVKLHDDETPILACIFARDSWTLLTTMRLLWRDNEGLRELNLYEIADATVDTTSLADGDTKISMRRLTVVTKLGSRHDLSLEPGAPFSGLWNVLKTIARAVAMQ